MHRSISFAVVAALFGVLWACGTSGPKTKKLDRDILGAELEFGRRAADFDLWNEAIFRWEKVVTSDPENHEAINNLAVAYESVGNYEKARDLYQNALELDEDNRAIRQNYKRFLNFYKKHQRQIKREKARKERAEDSSEEGANDDAEPPSDEEASK